MKWFLIFSIFYLQFAFLLVLMMQPAEKEPILTIIVTAYRVVPKLLNIIVPLAIVGVVVSVIAKRFSLWRLVALLATGLLASIIFQTGFTLVKASLPAIIPFYADHFFAGLDAALHGGYDPYLLANGLLERIRPEIAMMIYLKSWGPPAVFFPLILVMLDTDAARIKRFMILYLFAWILIGNVFALAGMSGGPVYFDRLYGGERFADLTATLAINGVGEGRLGEIQQALWNIYSGDYEFIGPGISAFPSVHVSIAALIALYCIERHRVLGAIGVGYLAIIFFLSVFTGYHYAVDGYFSIAVMAGSWAYLRRRSGYSVQEEPQGGMVQTT